MKRSPALDALARLGAAINAAERRESPGADEFCRAGHWYGPPE